MANTNGYKVLAIKTINRAWQEIKPKYFNKRSFDCRKNLLNEIDSFVESEWLVTLCDVAGVDSSVIRKKFEEQINERFECIYSNR